MDRHSKLVLMDMLNTMLDSKDIREVEDLIVNCSELLEEFVQTLSDEVDEEDIGIIQ